MRFEGRSPRLLGVLAVLALGGCGGPTSAGLNPASATPSIAPIDCRAEAALGLSTPSAGPVQYQTITVDSRLRDYRVYTPPRLDTTKPFPLVLVLHGAPVDAATNENVIHFQPEADAGGFMAVSPDGCNEDWNETGGSFDVHFISKLLDRLESQYPIDRTRVYLTGVSAGGFMGYRLACDLADRIAAFASVAGSMWWNDCAPTRPVPILEMHGTLDANVPYDGGQSTYNGVSVPPILTVMKRWATLDNCEGDPADTKSGITTTSIWSHCAGGVVVQLDTVVGGHHTWFGSEFDPVPHEPSSDVLVWSFLKQFSR